jgi:formylglycine-generating enzyme required for sulfatase activity
MKYKILITSIISALLTQGCNSSSDSETVVDTVVDPVVDPVVELPPLEFVNIPTDGFTNTFTMSATEIPNYIYAQFLTEAYQNGDITFDSATGLVYDKNGYKMTDIEGSRVVKDHDNNGVYVVEEMENPLNMNFIMFDDSTQTFLIEDPATVNWNKYFDASIYPNVVDSIDDWFELSGNTQAFVGEGDLDGLLPTLEEVKTWPANFITYHGAKAFADFYGYALPTLVQWRLAAEGGESFVFSTSDGTDNEGVAWINIDGPGFPPHKGHVQPVNSKSPSPLGIYHLGGNVWEWVQDWYDGYEVFSMNKQTEDFFIDETISFEAAKDNYLKGLIGGSFNYFPATMRYDWNHAAMPETGNDHFGFRVVQN